MTDPTRPWSPDPRLSNVPADVLRQRRDSPVNVSSPALERTLIQLGALVNPIGRALYEWERAVVRDIFQTGVDASRIRIVETQVLNAPTTLGNQIRVSPGWTFENANKPVLVHEVMHVWQYQNLGTRYITDSVYHNAAGHIATGNRNVAYMNYRLSSTSSLTEFSAEEQATIVGDYYELTRIYQNSASPPAWVTLRKPDLPIYERLIASVRSASPRGETAIYQDSLMSQPPRGMDFSTPQSERFAPVVPLLEVRFRGL